MITLVIHGNPVAQPRAKATTVGGHARMYTPDAKVRPFKQAVVHEFIRASGRKLDGPVAISIFKVFSRPKRLLTKKAPRGRIWKPTKPDLDNLDKSILDALTDFAWQDDAQVCDAHSRKCYAAIDETPFVRIEITDLSNTEP